MKTKEELSVLKKEVEALNEKLTELSDEELLTVVGGVGEEYEWTPGKWCEGTLLNRQKRLFTERAKEPYKVLGVTGSHLEVRVYYFFNGSYACTEDNLVPIATAMECMKPRWAAEIGD